MSLLILKWDAAAIGEWSGPKLQKALTRALKNAGDQVARALYKDAVAHVKSRKRLPVARIRSLMKTKRPGAAATIQSMSWSLFVSHKPTALSKYPFSGGRGGALNWTRQGGAPVKVRVNVGGGGKVLPGAFVAKLKSGHEGIFVRGKKGQSGRDLPRLPIRQLVSSSVADVLRDGGAIDRLYTRAQAKMGTAFDRTLAAQLAKL